MFHRGSRWIMMFLSLPLTALYVVAAVVKMQAFSQLRDTLMLSKLIPYDWVGFVGATVIALELLIGLSLLLPPMRQTALQSGVILHCLFLSYAVWRLVELIPTPCSCFGRLFTLSPFAEIGINALLLGYIGLLLKLDSRLGGSGRYPTTEISSPT